MPTITDLAFTFVAVVGTGLLVADKGYRLWAALVSVAVWLLVEFAIVALAFVNAWYGLVD